MRSIPSEFDPEAVAAIDGRLDTIRCGAHVATPLVIESGSRAWGFPSPDSDYDCRFLFVRREDDYLSPWPRRDVIETPLTDLLDVNGWDLGKALKLLLKGNAVVIEWLTSPLVYAGDPDFRDDMLTLAAAHAGAERIALHYLHLGERQRHVFLEDGRDIQLKKIFYALRPATALRWLRLHPGEPVAPMHFPTLMRECGAPAEIREITADLIARKAVTRELGSARIPAPIAEFIDGEFALARAGLPQRSPQVTEEAKRAAETLFRIWVRRLGTPGGTSTPDQP
jgi:predicted nucleotidyltransferase